MSQMKMPTRVLRGAGRKGRRKHRRATKGAPSPQDDHPRPFVYLTQQKETQALDHAIDNERLVDLVLRAVASIDVGLHPEQVVDFTRAKRAAARRH